MRQTYLPGSFRARLLLTLLALLCGHAAPNGARADELSKGHRLLLEFGELQLHAFIFGELNGYNPSIFAQSNFNGFLTGGSSASYPQLYGNPGEFNWSNTGFGGAATVQPNIVPYLNTLRSWSYLDEQDITDPAIIQQAVTWFGQRRADQRFDRTLLYTNQFGFQFTEGDIANYMSIVKPDMLSFDWYVWGTSYPDLYANGSPTGLYSTLAKYRRLSLKGNDGTGNHPIPFHKWMQTWTATGHYGHGNSQAFGYRMAESELYLDQFAGWAYGAKWATAFTYDSATEMDFRVGPLLLDRGGPHAQPTSEFFHVARINNESKRLGRSLLTLLSTDVRIHHGPNTPNFTGTPEFAGNSDPFLKDVSATNLGTTNGGDHGDVVLGFFRPMLDEFQTGNPEDEIYFMIVNGLTWKDKSSAETAQLIHLEFDMGSSEITSLQRLSRITGEIEIVPLIHDGGSLYHLDLTLGGGQGDLFKYNTGSAFSMIPEPAGAAMLLLASGAAMRRRRK